MKFVVLFLFKHVFFLLEQVHFSLRKGVIIVIYGIKYSV